MSQRSITLGKPIRTSPMGDHMRFKIAATAVLLPLLAGCGSTSTSSPIAPTVEPATTAESSAAATPGAGSAGAKSSRGNLIKKVGEGASVTDKGKTVASFVVNSIQIDPKCTNEFAKPADNGHFVALNVSMETDPALVESVNPQFGLAGYAWKVVADNGTTFNGDVMSVASFVCLNDKERFPSALGPGEKATGTIILDVPTPSGVLIHQQGFMPAGWEWAYPAK